MARRDSEADRYKSGMVSDMALAVLFGDAEVLEDFVPYGRGGMEIVYKIGDTALTKPQYNLFKVFLAYGHSIMARLQKDKRLLPEHDALMTDEQILAFVREKGARILKRTVELAMVSDDLKAVSKVSSDLLDRGFGKPAAQVNLMVKDKDVRAAWAALEDKSAIDVGHSVIEVADAEVEDADD